jgi:phosphoribosyl 1,2-cyclic phosphodiesterase
MQLRLSFFGSPTRFCVLGSGSSGNSVVIESAGRSLLVDAGFSCREIERRLAAVGVTPESIEGVVLTHEHSDHVRGASRLIRRHRLQLHATSGTLEEIRLHGSVPAPVALRPEWPAEIGSFRVEPFAVPHDAREPIGLVVETESGFRIGLAADLGSASRQAWSHLRNLDALILETNHDLEMLLSGPYPWALKRRIAGRRGHLSNQDAAQGLREILDDRLRWLVLYHLSRVNNRPGLAEATVAEELERLGAEAETCVSNQFGPTPWLSLGAEGVSLVGPEAGQRSARTARNGG